MKASASLPKTLRSKITQKVPGPLAGFGLLRDLVPFAFVIFFLFLPLHSAYAGTYGENLRYGLKRGVKNIVSAPGEIFVGIQDYHERAGWPYARQGIGFFVGTGKMLLRFGSGVVDLGAAWIPGLQRGIPVNPEVLF